MSDDINVLARVTGDEGDGFVYDDTRHAATRRTLGGVGGCAASFLEADRTGFGQMMQCFDGIPLGLSDHISDGQTVGTSDDCSTIHAVQFGEGGVAGLTAPGASRSRTSAVWS